MFANSESDTTITSPLLSVYSLIFFTIWSFYVSYIWNIPSVTEWVSPCSQKTNKLGSRSVGLSLYINDIQNAWRTSSHSTNECLLKIPSLTSGFLLPWIPLFLLLAPLEDVHFISLTSSWRYGHNVTSMILSWRGLKENQEADTLIFGHCLWICILLIRSRC